MDFQLNKILGAILGTLLFVMGLGFLADAIYAPAQSAGPGFALPSEAEGGPGNGNGATAAVADIGTLLAKADPKAGETSAKKCAACHDFTEGGPNKTGPNLFDVVERPIASHPGFSYSAALQGKASDKWTYENLNAWLTSPKTFAPGTKMSYAGDKDDTDRANLIAYLSTLSKSPKPFPAPAAPAAPAASAPSSEAAPAPASSSAAAAAPAAASSEAPAAPAASSTAPAAPASSEAPAAPASSQAPAVPASSEAAPASSSAAQ